jgi:hypothetical protein
MDVDHPKTSLTFLESHAAKTSLTIMPLVRAEPYEERTYEYSHEREFSKILDFVQQHLIRRAVRQR